MPAQAKHWPKLDTEFPQNLQREQPVIGGNVTATGSRYTIVTIINDTVQKVQVDSDSFLNVISRNLALKLIQPGF